MSRARNLEIAALCGLMTAGAAALVAGALAGAEGTRGFADDVVWTEGFREPAAVEALSGGAVAVADYSAQSVTVLEEDGQIRWRVEDGLDHPSGLDSDETSLWVADAGNHRLLRLAQEDGDQLASIDLADELQPTDVAIATGGQLWVSSTPQDRLLLVDLEGTIIVSLEAAGDEPLQGPRGLLADSLGGVYVAEALGGRILHLDNQGALLETLGEWGLEEGNFVKPKDLAFLPDGDLVVVDSHQGVAQVVGLDGSFRRLVSGPDDVHRFEHVLGVAVSGDRVFIADAGAAGIRVLQAGGPAWLDGRFPAKEVVFRDFSVRDADPSGVCRQCHDGTRRLTAGNWDPGAENHPLDIDPDIDLPIRFARTENGHLLCRSCHQVHFASYSAAQTAREGRDVIVDFDLVEELEVVAPTGADNGICMECHADYVDMEPAYRRQSHPVGLLPPEGAELETITDAGGRLDAGSVGCMSCHRPHGAGERRLLVIAANAGSLCLTCHADHAPGESAHPVGVEVDDSTRRRIIDMGGVVAEDGTLTCLSCHDPHQSAAGTLLRTAASGFNACRLCHTDEAEAMASGGHGEEGCSSCHGMHKTDTRRGRGARKANVGPQICLDCHTDRSSRPQVDLAATHPLGVDLRDKDHGSLPLVGGRIACTTCHEAHGADARLLRLGSDAGETCLECHEDKTTVRGTDHDARVVGVRKQTDTCLSCHDVHGSDNKHLIIAERTGENPASGRCLVCHDGSMEGPTPVEHYTHPEGLLLTTQGLPFRYDGPTPYYDPDGRRTTDRGLGTITCSTCHDPHRWKHDSDSKPGAVKGTEQNSFLRDPAQIIRFCTVCHGSEGRPMFRFFHKDSVRKAEGDQPEGGTP